MSRLVLDASVTLCWLFEDQATAFTDGVLDRIAGGGEALTSVIWPLEVANALVVAERRKLIKPAQSGAFAEALRQLPIRVEPVGAERAFCEVLEAARRYRLSAYDASYLDLAMRETLPLATVDGQLRNAARAAGVRLA
ncbi:MAG: type II toxin-antitoxin system VapC family toxin [Candidatus Binataceae bacterium]